MYVEGTKLTMIRGDSENITVTLKDKSGGIIPLVPGDTIYFTVKRSINYEEKILQKVISSFTVDGRAIIEILPEDTRGVPYKSYVYDIQLIKADGSVKTIIGPDEFSVKGEVTYE